MSGRQREVDFRSVPWKDVMGPFHANRRTWPHTLLFVDYKPQYYYWEVVELARRITLTGWVALVNESNAFIRIVSCCPGDPGPLPIWAPLSKDFPCPLLVLP